MVYTMRMSDTLDPRIAELLAQFRKDIADLIERHEVAVREELEKIRQERLAELRSTITTSN